MSLRLRSPLLRPLVSWFVLAGIASAQAVPPMPVPSQNPMNRKKAMLGESLFWEEQLSSTRTVACGTCHIPGAGGSDPRSMAPGTVNPGFDGVFGTPDDVHGSVGVPRNLADGTYKRDILFGLHEQVTGRRAPSAINAGFAPDLFWDGRATSAFTGPVSGVVEIPSGGALESQAAGPPTGDMEMAHEARTWGDVVARLQGIDPLALAQTVPPSLSGWIAGRNYPALFIEVFGSGGLTAENAIFAIAAYERTLLSNQTPYDAFLAGNTSAMSTSELRGLEIFNGAGACVLCHSGPLLTDGLYHNIGVRPPIEDLGRGAVTGRVRDAGAFKTPGLRNVALRAPFLHNGSQTTLAGVVDLYNRGGDFSDNLDPFIFALGLTAQERSDLVSFLQGALTDPRVAAETGPFVRPKLWSESNLRPALFGRPTGGSGGIAPEIAAYEPGLVGNPSMTIGIDHGLGGAVALLLFQFRRAPYARVISGATTYLAFGTGLLVLSSAPLRGTGIGGGWDSVSVPIPLDPSLVGSRGTSQWAVMDPGAPGGISATRAVSIPIF